MATRTPYRLVLLAGWLAGCSSANEAETSSTGSTGEATAESSGPVSTASTGEVDDETGGSSKWDVSIR